MVDAARIGSFGVESMSDATGGSVRVGSLGVESMSKSTTPASVVLGGAAVEVLSKGTGVGSLGVSALAVEVMSNQIAQAGGGLAYKLLGEPTYVGFGRSIQVFGFGTYSPAPGYTGTAITAENGDVLTTESGDVLITG